MARSSAKGIDGRLIANVEGKRSASNGGAWHFEIRVPCRSHDLTSSEPLHNHTCKHAARDAQCPRSRERYLEMKSPHTAPVWF